MAESGLSHIPAKDAGSKGSPGFESLSFRMISRAKHKGFLIEYNPKVGVTSIVLLNKVIKTIKNLPRDIAKCRAKIWVNNRNK